MTAMLATPENATDRIDLPLTTRTETAAPVSEHRICPKTNDTFCPSDDRVVATCTAC